MITLGGWSGPQTDIEKVETNDLIDVRCVNIALTCLWNYNNLYEDILNCFSGSELLHFDKHFLESVLLTIPRIALVLFY